MLKVTIELPEVVTLFSAEGGEKFDMSFKKLADSGKAESFIGGRDGALVRALRVVGQNAYNSGGSAASKVEKAAKAHKRIGSWEQGDWAIVERGEGIMTAYRDEVFIPLCLESGMTLKEAEALIKAKVAEYFPPDTKATFANFIEATAIERKAEFGGDANAAREAVESYYDEQFTTRRAARDKAESKVKMPVIDLGAFKKASK